jgi:fructosamine-3-kinase
MKHELPGLSEFASVIAQLHQTSVSPTGKFGFHITTYRDNQPMENTWCETWEDFFTQATRKMVQNEISVQGESKELYELTEKLCKKVIQRLLRPLEIGGRKIKPSIVHVDLWHGSVGIKAETDEPILFDGCTLYAYNECQSDV